MTLPHDGMLETVDAITIITIIINGLHYTRQRVGKTHCKTMTSHFCLDDNYTKFMCTVSVITKTKLPNEMCNL